MIEDVEREAEGEIITSPLVRKAIASKTALMFKDMLRCCFGTTKIIRRF
jgi:hypothetical protein